MPSVVAGTRGTADILANRQRIDISDTVHLLEPSSYPLIAFLNSLDKVKPAHNPVVRWMEDELEPLTDLVNAAHTAATSSSGPSNDTNTWRPRNTKRRTCGYSPSSGHTTGNTRTAPVRT